MTHPEGSFAHAVQPLAVLEAMRNLDSPSDEEVAEYVDELLKKRLGLSDTVAAQIARYEVAARHDGRVTGVELVQILRLAGRRPDAALVFADAGRRAARRAIDELPYARRWAARSLPHFVSRRIGLAAVRRAAGDVLGLTVDRNLKQPAATLDPDWPVQATPDGAACGFYAAALAELLRQLMEYEGAVTHVRCRARGDTVCEWRAGGPGEASR